MNRIIAGDWTHDCSNGLHPLLLLVILEYMKDDIVFITIDDGEFQRYVRVDPQCFNLKDNEFYLSIPGVSDSFSAVYYGDLSNAELAVTDECGEFDGTWRIVNFFCPPGRVPFHWDEDDGDVYINDPGLIKKLRDVIIGQK